MTNVTAGAGDAEALGLVGTGTSGLRDRAPDGGTIRPVKGVPAQSKQGKKRCLPCPHNHVSSDSSKGAK